MTDRAWFSHLLRHPVVKWSGSILSTPEPARGVSKREGVWNKDKEVTLTPLWSLRLRPNCEGPARSTSWPRNGYDMSCTMRGSCWTATHTVTTRHTTTTTTTKNNYNNNYNYYNLDRGMDTTWAVLREVLVGLQHTLLQLDTQLQQQQWKTTTTTTTTTTTILTEKWIRHELYYVRFLLDYNTYCYNWTHNYNYNNEKQLQQQLLQYCLNTGIVKSWTTRLLLDYAYHNTVCLCVCLSVCV